MSVRDLRIGWRTLLQDPGYAAVSVFGLAAGLATFFLLLSWVQYSFSYDAHVPDADRVFVLKHRMNLLEQPQFMEQMPLPFKQAAEKTGMTTAATAVVEQAGNVRVDGHTSHVPMHAVDRAFVDIFGVSAIEGDIGRALSKPDALALTAETARSLFGTSNALGRTLQMEGKTFSVEAILRDPPTNTTVPYAALVGMQSAVWPAERRTEALTQWGHLGGRIYVKLARSADADALADALQQAADHSPFRSQLPAEVLQQLGTKKIMDIRVGALRDAYFDPALTQSNNSGPRASKASVLGAAAVGVLVLALAMSNYVNLATVRTIRRQREIAIRKILGATPRQVISLFMLESTIIALVAAVLGWLLAAWLQPAFGALVNRQLDSMFTPGAMLACAGVALLVGLAAGIYPSWMALQVRASQALAGRGGSETAGGAWIRRGLTVLQVGAAVALCSVTTAVAWQASYASAIDPGFDPARMLVVDLPESVKAPAARALREAVARLPGVKVAAAMDAVGRARSMTGWELPAQRGGGSAVTVNVQDVSANYFHTYGVKPLAGVLFDPAGVNEEAPAVVVLNEPAVRALGFSSPQEAVGKPVTLDAKEGALTVVGVVPDMGRHSLHEIPRPQVFRPGRDTEVLVVRSQGDIEQLRGQIDALWQQYYPYAVLQMDLERRFFGRRYADDLALAKLLGIATVMAAAIAGCGIYVLAAYSVQRRAKQVVLHKLFGAPARAVVWLVGREFAILIAVGALLALPFGVVAISQYLASFVDHAPIGGWTIALSACAAALIAALATGRHVLEALRMTPARVLRA